MFSSTVRVIAAALAVLVSVIVLSRLFTQTRFIASKPVLLLHVASPVKLAVKATDSATANSPTLTT